MYNIYIYILYLYVYSLTYVLISTMVFGKFSVLRKKAICTESVFANTRKRAFNVSTDANDIVPDGNVLAISLGFLHFGSFQLYTEV